MENFEKFTKNSSEQWKPVEGFPDYMVSDMGRVMSLKVKPHILTPFYMRDGYQRLSLFRDGKRYNARVNRLVAMAFIPNPENKPQVNHINEDKADNRAVNLNWMTNQENCNHGHHNENVGKAQRGRPTGREPGNKGKHWFNDGERNIYADECPSGYVPGMLKR